MSVTSDLGMSGTADSERGMPETGRVLAPSHDRLRRLDSVPLPAPPRPRWEGRYALAVMVSDIIALLTVVVIGHVLGLGDYAPRFGGVISPELGVLVTLL